MTPPRTSSWIVFLAGLTIVFIALFQTVTHGAPDQYTIGALLALALGGGVGRVVDTAVKGYVKAQVDSAKRDTGAPGNGSGGSNEPPA